MVRDRRELRQGLTESKDPQWTVLSNNNGDDNNNNNNRKMQNFKKRIANS